MKSSSWLLGVLWGSAGMLLGLPASAEWSSVRNGPEGQASLVVEQANDLQEWYYNYKHTLRYRIGLTVWASPALALVDGQPLAFVGGHSQTLLALDLAQRQVRWLKITNSEIDSTPVLGPVDGVLTVFFTSSDRSVYAHNARTGASLWTKELIPPSPTLGTVSLSSPVLHGDHLYIAAFRYDKSLARNRQQASLFCLKTATGQVEWQWPIASGPVSSPVGFNLDGEYHLAIAARKGFVQCYNLSTGQPSRRWTYQMPQEVLGSPVVEIGQDQPYLFLGSKFGNLVALDARTGEKRWQHMAGHWIDNSACVGSMDGRNVVFVGSYDYRLYAFAARSGELLWSRALGGEVYSAPAFFHLNGEPMVVVACLDNRVYVVKARRGELVGAFFSGDPLWDKTPKGEALMGSPVVLEAGKESVIVHAATSGAICVFPLDKPSTFRDTPRSFTSLWIGLWVALLLFLGIALPVVLRWPQSPSDQEQARRIMRSFISGS